MKTILLHIRDDAAMEARFQAALALARQQGGHLTCVQTLPSLLYAADPATSPGAYELLFQSIEEPARVQRAALEERLNGEGLAWDWRVETGGAAAILLQEAQLSDLMVIGSGDEALDMSVAGSLIMHAQVPLLAVSGEVERFDPTGPIMIAWNGAPEAANAVRHGLPLLRAAASVHIICVAEQSPGLPASNLAAYLSRHGIHAEVQERLAEPSIEEVLQAAAGELGVSCIVMGGYGHSRMREFVFGGVTRAMLRGCPVPLLLSH